MCITMRIEMAKKKYRKDSVASMMSIEPHYGDFDDIHIHIHRLTLCTQNKEPNGAKIVKKMNKEKEHTSTHTFEKKKVNLITALFIFSLNFCEPNSKHTHCKSEMVEKNGFESKLKSMQLFVCSFIYGKEAHNVGDCQFYQNNRRDTALSRLHSYLYSRFFYPFFSLFLHTHARLFLDFLHSHCLSTVRCVIECRPCESNRNICAQRNTS